MDYRLGRLKGQFVVVWEEGGRRRRYRLGALSPVEARAALREFVRGRERLAGPSEKLTVEDIWNDYIREKQADGKPIRRMADSWKQLFRRFAALTPADCIPETVRGYIAERRHAGRSDGTIHTELGYLRAAFRHSAKLGRIANAPAITLPSKPRSRSRHLTPGEARRLIDAAQMPHVRLFIRLALFTAGRPSSLLDLSWDRVCSERRQIRLDNPTRDRTAKGRATVPIAQELITPLKEAREAALTEYVIEWAGKKVLSVKKGVAAAAKRAGLEGVTPYVLRHTAAVWMAEGGVPMEEIAQFMGHGSPAITFKTYARYSPEHLRRAGEAISTALRGSLDLKAGE